MRFNKTITTNHPFTSNHSSQYTYINLVVGKIYKQWLLTSNVLFADVKPCHLSSLVLNQNGMVSIDRTTRSCVVMFSWRVFNKSNKYSAYKTTWFRPWKASPLLSNLARTENTVMIFMVYNNYMSVYWYRKALLFVYCKVFNIWPKRKFIRNIIYLHLKEFSSCRL